MLERAFENKVHPLTEEEKEEIMQLDLDRPSQTDDNEISNPLEEVDILDDVLDPLESIRSVGVPPLRSERHPTAINGTIGSVEVNLQISKVSKRKRKTLSEDSSSESSSNEHPHKVQVINKVKALPVSEPLEQSDQEKILIAPRPKRLRKPPSHLVDFACAAAHVGMSSGSTSVLSSSDMSKLIDTYGQSQAEDLVNLFAGHLQTGQRRFGNKLQ